MVEPSVACRIAIRETLIANPAVMALVPAANIRAGSTRPDRFPCIVLAGEHVEYLGHASGGWFLARVSLDAHIWAIEDGAEIAQAIGQAAFAALLDAPQSQEIGFDEWERPSVIWLRDPSPERTYGHGIMALEGVVRWRL